jgi:hypothetical protein
MAGASCGVFVAAYVSKAGIEVLDPLGLALALTVVGAIGFYLGIDIPPPPHARQNELYAVPAVQRADSAERLSAAGTLAAAMAALVSVYIIVFDAPLRPIWIIVIGFCWLFGVTMQIAAGTIARLRKADPAVG